MHLFDEIFDKNYSYKINLFIEKYSNSESNYILQTSGSTGIKKEIVVSKTQMQVSAQTTICALNLNKTDTALLCLNLDFVAGKMMIIRALEANMNLVLAKPNADLAQIIKKHPISFAAFVPIQIEKIITENGIEILNKISNIIIGGATISQKLTAKLQNCTSTIYQSFGMTETVSHIALRKINGNNPEKKYTILPNIEIKTNAENCLCIKGLVTNNVWVETTDIVQLIDNQQFIWIGRKDFIINSGGIKINPEEIESKIEGDFDCNYIISSIEDEKLGHKVVLVLEFENKTYDLETINLKISKKLTKYEMPKKIFILPSFPVLENGKINRLEIKKMIAQQNL